MKKRLTITLSKDLLQSIDGLIDGKTLRNRSHAIENLVESAIGFSVKTAVILAGGARNKKCVSLRKINGRYLLHYQLDLLKKYGITCIVLCAGRFEREIKKVFGDGSEMGTSLKYMHEPKTIGTAGAVRKAKKYYKNQRLLILHGDVLTDFDLSELFKFHASHDSPATIAVKPRLAERKHGKVIIRGEKIVEFIKEEGDKGISIVNAGVYLFEPEALKAIPKSYPSYFETDVFPSLAAEKKLTAYIFQGKWYEASRYKDYLKAKKEWLQRG